MLTAKLCELDMGDQFSMDMSPALTLLDVTGNRHPVLGADRAELAIEAADALYEMGGNGKVSAPDQFDPNENQTFLLYYRSHNGRAKRAEIARAARVIARCDVTLSADDTDGEARRISGTRALVYPERPGAVTGAVPFLISTRVWFNRNRSTMGFPYPRAQHDDDNELEMAIKDINARLMEGEVSAPRS
jgi:hypothetical protein